MSVLTGPYQYAHLFLKGEYGQIRPYYKGKIEQGVLAIDTSFVAALCVKMMIATILPPS